MNAVKKNLWSICGTLALILAGTSAARAEDLLEPTSGASQPFSTQGGELANIGSTHEDPEAGKGDSEKDWRWYRFRTCYHYHYYRPVYYYPTYPVVYWCWTPVFMTYDGTGGSNDGATASTDKVSD